MPFNIRYDNHDLEALRTALSSPELNAAERVRADYWLSAIGGPGDHPLFVGPNDTGTREVTFHEGTLQAFRLFLMDLYDKYGMNYARKLAEDMGRAGGGTEHD